ncbi:hypothetical protein BC833DRAFT_621830 [Globomyces pollinis-pini]|nr:hypothetical protein BC833DRAFT_621830 [Globomyces pollinis-pini]KAJ2996591.1 hypothetical protein HDV02_006353 [Globomyces sp. JEL0801]
MERKPPNTVSALKPHSAIPLTETTTVFQAAAYMAAKRHDAILIVNADGELSGIITDRDLAYRVVALELNTDATPVSTIMTRNPASVTTIDPAMDALNKMMAGKFRHLPVVHEIHDYYDGMVHVNTIDPSQANVFGIIDITKCLYDQIERLEKAQLSSQKLKDALMNAEDILPNMVGNSSYQAFANMIHSKMELQTLSNLMDIDPLQAPLVNLNSSVLDAVKQMADARTTGVLVVDTVESGSKLVGIFTTKDLVLRVLAAKLDPAATIIDRVMTPNPDFISPDITLLDALKKMHSNKYLHLPVVKDGTIFGMADVLKLTYHLLRQINETERQEGPGPIWDRFWEESSKKSSDIGTQSYLSGSQHARYISYSDDGDTIDPDDSASMITPSSSLLKSQIGRAEDEFVFKFRDEVANKTTRFTSNIRDLDAIRVFIANKVFQTYGGRFDKNSIHLCYMDEEEDLVNLITDRDLEDGVLMAKSSGLKSLVLMLDRRRMKFKNPRLDKMKSIETIQNDDFGLTQQFEIVFPIIVSGAIVAAGVYLLSRPFRY